MDLIPLSREVLQTSLASVSRPQQFVVKVFIALTDLKEVLFTSYPSQCHEVPILAAVLFMLFFETRYIEACVARALIWPKLRSKVRFETGQINSFK